MHLLSQHPGNAFTNKYAGELIQTAASLVVRGKGILAKGYVLQIAIDTRMRTDADMYSA